VTSWIGHGNQWHVLMFHGIGAGADGYSPISPEKFAREMSELAAYRDASKADVLTFGDAASRMRTVRANC